MLLIILMSCGNYLEAASSLWPATLGQLKTAANESVSLSRFMNILNNDFLFFGQEL